MKIDRPLSAKQWEIMEVILKGNPDGTWVDLDQLIDRLTYAPKKQSIHFSTRSLVSRGLIEKKPVEHRRGQVRSILAPTSLGYEQCRR